GLDCKYYVLSLFFSSRRRHTRSYGDWSSDVCSSDLFRRTPDTELFQEFDENLRDAMMQETQLFVLSQLQENRPVTELVTADYSRSEERRVGKEGRSRWGAGVGREMIIVIVVG